ncbi:hypothetical protein QBC42DRAFT_310834 [Cladorrhinum samala]|uniref:Uncharacterized protein n=1 Tax=Cladorrhinum samala TaxID=585594 RepID=A0AAV9HYG1_9PEZI|nr:hypothetical protein QBC42DRAFT_310834 [Cladorrhinum samala]
MPSSVGFARMENAPIFSRSSASGSQTDMDMVKRSKSSRLSVFATIRRRTSRLFNHKEHATSVVTEQQPWPSRQLKKRQSWFNSVKVRYHHQDDYCSEDARTDLDDLAAAAAEHSAKDRPQSPVKRLLRTSSSVFLSLRGKGHVGDCRGMDEGEDQDGNELIHTLEHHDVGTDIPDLTLPAVYLKPNAYRRSSFQLGVQKAVRDTVDQNFSLDGLSEASSQHHTDEFSSSARTYPLLPCINTKISEREGSEEWNLLADQGITFISPSPISSTYAQPDSPQTFFSNPWSATSSSRAFRSGSDEGWAGAKSSDSGVINHNFISPPSTPQSIEVDCTLAQLHQLREEELKALIKNKTGALTLAGRDRLVLSLEALEKKGRPVDGDEGHDAISPMSPAVHEDDRTTLSMLEGDSSLVASTQKRSLREELLLMGEMSQICEGESTGIIL